MNTSSYSSACPLCQTRGRFRFEAHAIAILDCPACGHRYAGWSPPSGHLESVYGDDYFHGGGAGYPDYLADGQLRRQTGVRCGRILSRFAQPGRLLDVGAAAGFVLQGLAETGWPGEGVEPNTSMAAFARDRLGIPVHAGTLASVEFAEPFDAVTWIQVLGHFPNPIEAFGRADAITKPGGVWFVKTWNAESRLARILGEHWHEYSPPSVLHYWSPRVLNRTLAKLGYRLLGTGYPQKWIGLRHAKSLLAHKYPGLNTVWRRIPKSAALPYPSEDLFWSVYRKENSNRVGPPSSPALPLRK